MVPVAAAVVDVASVHYVDDYSIPPSPVVLPIISRCSQVQLLVLLEHELASAGKR